MYDPRQRYPDTGAYRPPHTQALTPLPAPSATQHNRKNDTEYEACLIDLGPAPTAASPASMMPTRNMPSSAPRVAAISSPPPPLPTAPNQFTMTATAAYNDKSVKAAAFDPIKTAEPTQVRGSNVQFTSALARRQAMKEQQQQQVMQQLQQQQATSTEQALNSAAYRMPPKHDDPFAELVVGNAAATSMTSPGTSALPSPHSAEPLSENDDNDPVVKQAQEAALYAEQVLLQQKGQKKQGWGMLPFSNRPPSTEELLFQKDIGEPKEKEPVKAPAPAVPSTPQPQPSSLTTPATPTHSSATNTISVSVPDRDPRDYYGNEGGSGERIPWYSAERRAQSEADYGLPAQRTSNHSNDNDSTDEKQNRSAGVVGASVLGGVAGLVLAGPVAGVVAAGSLAYAATTQKGILGGAVRGAGQVVAQIGSAAKQAEDKHHVVANTASGVAKGVGWLHQHASTTTPK